MLNLSLSAVARAPVRLQGQVPGDDPVWAETGIKLTGPLRFELEARSVGEGVLVRGSIDGRTEIPCRRCLKPVPVTIHEQVELLFEPLTAEEEADLNGEVYPLPERGDLLDLSGAIREHLMLRYPDYVLCSEGCRGLCPICGAELNDGGCSCVPERVASPWDALKDLEFD